jgi:glutaredoxin
MNKESNEIMSEKIILFGHPGCPSVPLARTILEKAGADFEYINIRSDELGRSQVREINHGYESVPTLLFPDGSWLTEPSHEALRDKLRSIGYKASIPDWVNAFDNLIKCIAAQRK